VKLRSAARRIKSAVRPTRAPSQAERWRGYLAAVEPVLANEVRLHRFAAAPTIGPATIDPDRLAVWIDGGGLEAERTAASLDRCTVAPAAVFRGSLQEALQAGRTSHLVLLRAGDMLAPLALERLGQAAALAPDTSLLTADEDQLGPAGERLGPHFRPGPSPDRWLACDDSGSLLVVSRAAAAQWSQTASVQPGWRHELALALAGAGSQQHAHVPLLLCHRTPQDGVSDATSPDAVARILRAWEPGASVERSGDHRRVRRPLQREPGVEIIICFRDKAELTRRCVESLLALTEYDRFRITLVDNGSVQPETDEFLRAVADDRRIRVSRDTRPFNFAALNNAAARTTDAEFLVFLNNDTEVLDPDWLAELLEEAARPEVGAVAPMLLFGNGNVQHAGAALGLHGYAGHPFAGLAPDADTPFGAASGGTRNWLAVSAACMIVERAKFEAVGGFDESFVVAGNDVDLCLRLTAAGHRSLCVPHVRLLHDESRSRGDHIDAGDFAASQRSYGAFRIVGDPFYNPSLTLQLTDCSVRAPGEGP
jgi:GT2 family glycosyltransferase